MSELLPCPFCGPGQSVVDPWFDDVSKRWAVGCGRCGSSSGRSVHAEGSKEAAIKSWNRRGYWQPIETAPKDGTLILVTDDRVKEIWAVAAWDAEEESMAKWSTIDGNYHQDRFTHWQPLPAPPSRVQAVGE